MNEVCEKFNWETLEFFLPVLFKNLSKGYMLDCIFDDEIQKKWKPKIGDIIVNSSGNIFVISNHDSFSEEFGGDTYYFGGGLYNNYDGIIFNQTYCFVLNNDGMRYYRDKDCKIQKEFNSSYSKISDYRFIPYPHEI